jgi:PLP dependent protein
MMDEYGLRCRHGAGARFSFIPQSAIRNPQSAIPTTSSLARRLASDVQSAAMNLPSLSERLAAVRERIAAAQSRAGRGGVVTLVTVTKRFPAEVIREAIAAGVTDIGENRVPELEEKVQEVGRDAVRWHLVGHLQRNKSRRAIPHFDLLHSLDSVRLARQLSEDASALGRRVEALVQVNTSGEESKYGLAADAALDVIAEMSELPALKLVGVMTMAPFVHDEVVLRRTFAGARRIWEEAARSCPSFEARHLSMGMSNDFELAVEEGSTMIRLGTALLGERDA